MSVKEYVEQIDKAIQAEDYPVLNDAIPQLTRWIHEQDHPRYIEFLNVVSVCLSRSPDQAHKKTAMDGFESSTRQMIDRLTQKGEIGYIDSLNDISERLAASPRDEHKMLAIQGFITAATYAPEALKMQASQRAARSISAVLKSAIADDDPELLCDMVITLGTWCERGVECHAYAEPLLEGTDHLMQSNAATPMAGMLYKVKALEGFDSAIQHFPKGSALEQSAVEKLIEHSKNILAGTSPGSELGRKAIMSLSAHAHRLPEPERQVEVAQFAHDRALLSGDANLQRMTAFELQYLAPQKPPSRPGGGSPPQSHPS
ncbi:MAG: hypothetical protein WDO70_10495 [Alphaproteobacteria bacterium]